MSKELVDAIIGGDNISVEPIFKDAMVKKVGDSLETKRQEISKTFVTTDDQIPEMEIDSNE